VQGMCDMMLGTLGYADIQWGRYNGFRPCSRAGRAKNCYSKWAGSSLQGLWEQRHIASSITLPKLAEEVHLEVVVLHNVTLGCHVLPQVGMVLRVIGSGVISDGYLNRASLALLLPPPQITPSTEHCSNTPPSYKTTVVIPAAASTVTYLATPSLPQSNFHHTSCEPPCKACMYRKQTVATLFLSYHTQPGPHDTCSADMFN
jgi:hypothetical protein